MTELSGFYRGDDHALRIVIKEKGSNDPVDVTDWYFISSMKLSSEMPDTPELDDEGNRQVLKVDVMALAGAESEAGECTLLFPHDKTRQLIPTTYQIDIQRTYQDSVITIFRGTIPVLSDVTHDVGLSE